MTKENAVIDRVLNHGEPGVNRVVTVEQTDDSKAVSPITNAEYIERLEAKIIELEKGNHERLDNRIAELDKRRIGELEEVNEKLQEALNFHIALNGDLKRRLEQAQVAHINFVLCQTANVAERGG